MTFDWTISVGNLVVIMGGLYSFVRVGMNVRDSIRTLTVAIGSKENGDGLWGVVTELRENHGRLSGEVTSHREWILQHDARTPKM